MNESEFSDDYIVLKSVYDGEDPGRRYVTDNLDIMFNSKNPQKSMVTLEFGNLNDFLELIKSSFNSYDSDVDFIERAFGGYYNGGNIEAFNEDMGLEDFKEGYLIRYFDEKSMDILKEIIKYSPTQLSLEKVDDYGFVANFLLSNKKDEREIDNIITEFCDYQNKCITEMVTDEVKAELSNLFMEFNIYEKYFLQTYLTTVSNLVYIYEENGLQDKSVNELIEFLSEKQYNSFGDYWDTVYNLQCNDFDSDGFNYYVQMYLNKILDRYESEFDEKEDFDREKFNKMHDYIKNLKAPYSTYKGKHWFEIPSMPDYIFTVKSINYDSVIITLNKKGDEWFEEDRQIKFDDFESFMNNYKLFESKY